jgi:raffinose/stachyose/melibiose transport system substrate-binding protein
MKKLLSLLLVLCMCFGLLAGCSSKEDKETVKDETTNEDTNNEGTSDATPTDATEAEAAPTEAEVQEPTKVTLDVMMSFPRFQDQMEAYFEKFKAKMLAEKNMDVTINLEMPSSDSYDNILQTRISGDDAPDLYTLSAAQDLATYVEAGYVAPLTKEPLAGKIYEDVKETVSIEGEVYAVPFESTVWGYMYNKDIFEECGLTVPETLDEMKNVVSVLEEKGYVPFELAFQEQWVPQLMTALTLGGIVSGTPSLNDWVDRMYADSASYSEVAAIFDIIDLIMKHGTERAMETGSEQGSADFANGQAAMWVQGTWNAESVLSTNPDMKIGCAALPVTSDPNTTLINLATTTSLVVSSSTEEMEAALALANFILDDTESSALYEALKFNPVATIHNFEQYSWAQEASAYVAAGRAYRDLVLPGAVTDEQGKLLQSYYVGDVSKDDIIASLDKTFKEANKAAKQAE